jgi:hypothetical protein
MATVTVLSRMVTVWLQLTPRRQHNATQVIEKMVRPERFELPTFWFVARIRALSPIACHLRTSGQPLENTLVGSPAQHLSLGLRLSPFAPGLVTVWLQSRGRRTA